VKNKPLTSPHFGQCLAGSFNSGLFSPIKIGKRGILCLAMQIEGGRGTGQISGESEANGIADASLRDRTESKVPSLAREETNEERNRRS